MTHPRSSRGDPFLRPFTASLVCVLLIGGFFIGTLRDGHAWGDDFAMYIHHAKNIVEGKSYADTGYIYNPHYAQVGPRLYPPIFPFILAPLYAAFGLVLAPMKTVVILFWLASLLLIFEISRDALPAGHRIALILLLGWNPSFWEMKDNVVSDIPFLFFFLLALLLIRRITEGEVRGGLWRAAATGLVIYVGCATRTIGVVLVLILLLSDFLGGGRISRRALVALSVFGALFALQASLLPKDTSYLDQLHVTPAAVARNLIEYVSSASFLFDTARSDLPRRGLLLAAGALAALGYATRIRSAGVRTMEIAPWVYAIPILLWTSRGGLRLLVPIVPFLMLYALIGLRALGSRLPGRWGSVLFVAVMSLFALVYVERYTRESFGPFPEGVAMKSSAELFDFLRSSTAPQDVLVFSKPRLMALMTGRPVSAFHTPADESELWGYLREIHAGWLIAGPDSLGAREAYLRRFATTYHESLKVRYANADFIVFHVEGYPF